MASFDRADPNTWRKTKIRVIDVTGSEVAFLDITNIPNANAQATLVLEVVQRCDMEHWHRVSGPIPTSPWGYE